MRKWSYNFDDVASSKFVGGIDLTGTQVLMFNCGVIFQLLGLLQIGFVTHRYIYSDFSL